MRITNLAIASGLLAATAFAQGDFAFDKKTPATFSSNLKLDWSGAPASQSMMLCISANAGPTPLAVLFGGGDSRSLQVGLDMLSIWFLWNTGATGSGSFNFAVPNSPITQGFHVHMQLMTGPGASFPIDKLSNSIAIVPGATGTADLLKAKLGDGRTPQGPGRAMMAVFPISSHEFMLAGGGIGNILGANGLQTTEVFSARTLSIKPGPNLTAARALNTSTVLANGKVLIVGGVDSKGVPTATCELYDPKTNKFTATGSMGTARAGHAATRLGNGKVLVAAGTSDLTVTKLLTAIKKTCEIYDPTTGKWTSTGNINNNVIGPDLTTLSSGKVLVSGGAFITTIFGIPFSVNSTNACQLYDVTTGKWTATGKMVQHRSVHDTNTILLKDGRVLVTGGVAVNIPITAKDFSGAKATAKAEYYTPKTGKWTALPNMAVARMSHTSNQTPNGKVLVAGGATGSLDKAVSSNSLQEFDPSKNTFVRAWKLRLARSTHGSALLPDGSLVLFGGTGSAAATTTINSIETIHQ